MTSLTDTQVITASGGLVELGYGEITSSVTVSSTTESSGTTVVPAITVVSDGSPLDIEFSSARARVTGHPSGNYVVFNVVIDGTTAGRLGVVYSTGTSSLDVPVHLKYRTTLSAGSHTVAVSAWRYNADVTVQATGTAVGNELPTFLRVSKIVEATQWPAVTTGTIICTSSTRPASPFEGQIIYETDTGLSLIYDGSAWVSPSVTHKPPSVKLERTTGQVVYDASAAIMVWDSEVWDTDGMHDNAINQDRITVNTPGIYLVIGAVRYSAGVSDDSSVTIWLNGSTFIVRDEGGPANTAGGRTVSAFVNMNANDYLHLQVYQNNSANTSRTTTSGTFFSAMWQGQVS